MIAVGNANAILKMLRDPHYTVPLRREWLIGFSSEYRSKAMMLGLILPVLVGIGYYIFPLVGMYVSLCFILVFCILAEYPEASIGTILWYVRMLYSQSMVFLSSSYLN